MFFLLAWNTANTSRQHSVFAPSICQVAKFTCHVFPNIQYGYAVKGLLFWLILLQ